MPTEYNIKKIQLPNGDICNLPDDVKYIDITKSGESYSLPTGVTYTTIKNIIDNGELCILKVPFSGTDESGYKYFYPVKDYTYEVESTNYYDLKFVSSADPNETGIEVLTITSLNSVSIDNFPLGVSQSEVNTIIENKTVGVAYGESTTAAATAQKEVTVPNISELNVGQIIIVKPTITSTAVNSTLKVNDFQAYAMIYNGSAITTSTDSVVWTAHVPSMFILDEVSGTRYWRFLGHGLDSNSTYTLNRLIDAGQYTAGTGSYAVTRYSILAEKPNGTWEKITSTSSGYSTGTTKTVNTSGFVLNQLRYYSTTTNKGAGTLIATNYVEKQSPSVNYAYSFNCSTAPGWEIGDYIYLVGTLGVDGLFYLDTTQWWSTSLPTTEDGKLYIQLGLALTTTDDTGSFFMERPIFYYKNGAIKLWNGVSGTNDGTNWTNLTIDGVTKNIPSGGGGVSNVVICTFTENNSIITCDKSIEEMISAYASGRTCIGLMTHNNGTANEFLLTYIEGDVEDPTTIGSKVEFTATEQWGITRILGIKESNSDSWSGLYETRTTYIDTVCYEEPNSNMTITIGRCFDLNNDCFVKYSNNSWIADSDVPIYDGTILYAVADDAYYIYDSNYGIKQLSKGKSHIEANFDNQYYYLNCILPIADSFGEITLNDSNMGSSCYTNIDGMFTVNDEEFYNASVGKFHTICIYNSKSTDVDITVSDFYMTSVQGFISSGLNSNNTFTVKAGSHAELNIMFKDSNYSSTSYGNHALASIIVKSDFENNVYPIQ